MAKQAMLDLLRGNGRDKAAALKLLYDHGIRPGELLDDTGLGGSPITVVFRNVPPADDPNNPDQPYGRDPLLEKSRATTRRKEAEDPKPPVIGQPSPPTPQSLAQIYEELRTPDGDERERME